MTDPLILDEGWLGREIDRTFMSQIKDLPHVDACGEKGEYHTFVYDGPIFKQPVCFYEKDRVSVERYRISKLAPGRLE